MKDYIIPSFYKTRMMAEAYDDENIIFRVFIISNSKNMKRQ